jgi:hypothetical protein
MVYRYDKDMKRTLSLSPRCAARSRRSRALIILAGRPLTIELGVRDLGSRATPVVEGPDSIYAHPRP